MEVTGGFKLPLTAMAVIRYRNKPCDQPLHWYLPVFYLCVWLTSFKRQRLRRPFEILLQVFIVASRCSVIVWGFYMVQSTVSCPTVNPGLFHPMKHLIYCHMLVACLWHAASIIFETLLQTTCVHPQQLNQRARLRGSSSSAAKS